MLKLRSRLAAAAVLLFALAPLNGCGKFFVDGTATTTVLTASTTTEVVGASVTLTATLTPTAASGTVTFYDGATSLGTGVLASGLATLTNTTLTVGTHTLSAVYEGDGTYAVSTSADVTYIVTAS